MASGGLFDDDIDRMVNDAEANAEADKKRRGEAEARNNAQSLIHATEKSIEENKDKLDAGDVEAAEAAMADLKEALEKDDVEDINTKAQALSAAAMKLGEAIYKDQQEAAEAAAAQDAEEDDGDNVVDADFEEVDDDQKAS